MQFNGKNNIFGLQIVKATNMTPSVSFGNLFKYGL